jgi:hypothetical protein
MIFDYLLASRWHKHSNFCWSFSRLIHDDSPNLLRSIRISDLMNLHMQRLDEAVHAALQEQLEEITECIVPTVQDACFWASR